MHSLIETTFCIEYGSHVTCTFPLASSDNSMSQYSDMQQRGADWLAATCSVAKLQDRCKEASMHAAHWSDTPCALQDMQVARTDENTHLSCTSCHFCRRWRV